MKKFLALLCMITCIFALTACGNEESLSEYEQLKLERAEEVAREVVYVFNDYLDDELAASLDVYTLDELTYIMGQQQMNMTGYVLTSGVESFRSAKDTTGTLLEITGITAEIDDDTIIVDVSIKGEKKDSVAEIILSNDMFFDVESVSLNPTFTMGELMQKAALNTLIGMGTVFTVLILISLIIAAFGIIPKLQDKMAEKKSVSQSGVDDGVKQAAVQEEVTDEADDLELVAVIAAAIAASEGTASTDGFVVRSIRRRA